MTTAELIHEELRDLPEERLSKVLQFVGLLKDSGEESGIACALNSEAVLAKDWLTPEEDEAWRNL
jgi:hypothetical protein